MGSRGKHGSRQNNAAQRRGRRGFGRSTAEGGILRRGGRRRGQPPDGMGGKNFDRDRRGHEPVSPLRGLCDRSDPGTALHPRRLHAGAELPAVSRWRRAFATACAGGTSFPGYSRSRPSSMRCGAATTSPIAPPRPTAGTSSSASSSSCCCWKRRAARPARSCPWCRCCSSPMRCSVRICRRPGPIAATTCRGWSAISSSRWKAFSASRSTCRRR